MPQVLPRSQPEPQAVLQGVAAKLQQHFTKRQLGNLSLRKCKANSGGPADQASALGSNRAVQADRSAARRRQPRGLASLSSIAKRSPRAGGALPSRVGNPEPGQQPFGQLHMNGGHGRLAAGLETVMFAERRETLEEEPVQQAASAAAGAASSASASPRVEAWSLERMTAPRRLLPLDVSRQGEVSPATQLSGNWVSCLCAACTGSCALAAKLGRWSGPVCRWLS